MLTPLSDLSGHGYSKSSSKTSFGTWKQKKDVLRCKVIYELECMVVNCFTLVVNCNNIITSQLVAINFKPNLT
jgi:hypothetical protein